jgi:hypothetical protein
MPRPAKLPDLSDVDITELKLMILAVLERHGMGPEWRRSMRGAQMGGMLDLCGGAPAGARRGARGRAAAQRQPRRPCGARTAVFQPAGPPVALRPSQGGSA